MSIDNLLFSYRYRLRPRRHLPLPILCLLVTWPLAGAAKDTPFRQDSSVQLTVHPELQGAIYQRLAIDGDQIVYVLTDKGLARLFGSILALDKSFRPLAGKRPLDIGLHQGHLYYLYPDQFLSNGSAGKPLVHLPLGTYGSLVLADNGSALLSGDKTLTLWQNGTLTSLPRSDGKFAPRLYTWQNQFSLFNVR